jgi:hypothetical protein
MARQTHSKAVKALWSIVLGLVLALGQFAPFANGSDSVRTCACCSCARLDCCARPVLPAPLSAPASSQSNEQRIQAPALTIVAALIAPPVDGSSNPISVSAGFFSDSVPIYERNYSYLI